LQGFTYRRTADPQSRGQHLLGENVARLEPQCDDLLLDQPVGSLGERFRARGRGARTGAPST
jgi:hypothetical protein